MRRLPRDSAKAIINCHAGISLRHFVTIVLIATYASVLVFTRMFGISVAQHGRYLMCFDVYPCPLKRAVQSVGLSFIRTSVDLIQMISLRGVLVPPVLA